MKKFFFLKIFLQIILLIPVIAAQCRCEESFGDIRAEITAHPEGESQHGYFEYRIHLKNDSRIHSHHTEIVFGNPGNLSSRSNIIREMKKTVMVPPGADMTFSLMQPALTMSASSAAVFIDSVRQLNSLSVPYSRHGLNYRDPVLCILSSPSVNRDDLLRILDRTVDGKEKKRKKEISLIRSSLPSSAWSDSWLAYSRYDGIVVTDNDMRTMPVPAKWALLGYVKAGGILTVLGDFQLPEFNEKYDVNKTVYPMGFGQCIVLPVSCAADLTDTQVHYLHGMWQQTPMPWRKFDTPVSAGKEFPVAEDLEISVRGFFIGMLFFVIAVGPVNIFVLSRKKKKIWLLWTVPAISLFTCGAVFLYAVFSEGMDSDVRLSAFTILDENRHEAATLGMAAYYCRLTPGNGLRFSEDTEICPIVSQNYGDGTPRTINWTNSQHLESGWITARVPAHFQIRKYETRRERLQISTGKGTWAVNGLGADIRELWICDADGRLFYERNIPAGKRKSLRFISKGEKRGKYEEKLRQIYTSFKWKDPELWAKDLTVPGTYTAILDGCPFLEKGLENADNLTGDAIVSGIMAAPEK